MVKSHSEDDKDDTSSVSSDTPSLDQPATPSDSPRSVSSLDQVILQSIEYDAALYPLEILEIGRRLQQLQGSLRPGVTMGQQILQTAASISPKADLSPTLSSRKRSYPNDGTMERHTAASPDLPTPPIEARRFEFNTTSPDLPKRTTNISADQDLPISNSMPSLIRTSATPPDRQISPPYQRPVLPWSSAPIGLLSYEDFGVESEEIYVDSHVLPEEHRPIGQHLLQIDLPPGFDTVTYLRDIAAWIEDAGPRGATPNVTSLKATCNSNTLLPIPDLDGVAAFWIDNRENDTDLAYAAKHQTSEKDFLHPTKKSIRSEVSIELSTKQVYDLLWEQQVVVRAAGCNTVVKISQSAPPRKRRKYYHAKSSEDWWC